MESLIDIEDFPGRSDNHDHDDQDDANDDHDYLMMTFMRLTMMDKTISQRSPMTLRIILD